MQTEIIDLRRRGLFAAAATFGAASFGLAKSANAQAAGTSPGGGGVLAPLKRIDAGAARAAPALPGRSGRVLLPCNETPRGENS